MNYNSVEGFTSLLQFFFGKVWGFFTAVDVPFFGVSVGVFILALAALMLIIRVVFYIVGFSSGDTKSGNLSSGNKYKIYEEK